MFWYIFIAFAVFTLVWILLAPVIILVNSENKRYSLALPGVFHARLVPSTEPFSIRGSVFFFPYHINPFKTRRRKTREKDEKPRRKKKSYKPSEGLNLGRNMLHALKIRKLHLDIDTDDYTLNAWLIPVFSVVSSENIRLQANFEGNVSLLLDLRTRIGALIWAFLKSKYKSSTNQ